VLAVMERLKPEHVLEFGPGSSTLALVEGGAQMIDCCEDDPKWFDVYLDRLERQFPIVVKIHPYRWSDPVTVPGLMDFRYDMALIDGPRDTPNRPAVVEFCLQRCSAVLVPTESNEGSTLMRDACTRLALKYGRSLEFMQTGPLAGGFALIGAPC